MRSPVGMHVFISKQGLDKHIPNCQRLTNSNQKIIFPDPQGPYQTRVDMFKDFTHLLPIPYFVVADTEAFLQTMDISDAHQTVNQSYTKLRSKHNPSSILLILIGPERQMIDSYHTDEGNVIVKMIRKLNEWADYVIEKMKENNERVMTEEEEMIHQA